MSKINSKENPRFYEVAHEFGLIVEGEAHLTRGRTQRQSANATIQAKGKGVLQMSELEAIESATAVIENVHLVYRKVEADKVIADLEESHKMEVEQLLIEISELKAQKAQAEDDCAFWKNLAQKNATDNDNAVKEKQRTEAIKHYMELADKLKEKK